ncbi:hypothetical protein PSP6_400020 [Paraburkholderia tropica]|nr:hypothetical protein PSP6_400020 [Paraburkholderia tropica]
MVSHLAPHLVRLIAPQWVKLSLG